MRHRYDYITNPERATAAYYCDTIIYKINTISRAKKRKFAISLEGADIFFKYFNV